MDDSSERPARVLADELRSIIQDISHLEVSDEDLVKATRHARELRALIRGPERTRWYEADAQQHPSGGRSEASRIAYLEQSPIRGVLNPLAPPLRVEVICETEAGEPGHVEGRVLLGQAYEGLAGAVHGGWVAALFDDLLSAAQGLVDAPGVTAVLRTRFREVTPLYEELRMRAWVHERRGRRIVIRGTCHAGETLTADAEGIFMTVDFAQLRERMQGLRKQRGGV